MQLPCKIAEESKNKFLYLKTLLIDFKRFKHVNPAVEAFVYWHHLGVPLSQGSPSYLILHFVFRFVHFVFQSACLFVFGPSSKLWHSKNFALKNKSKLFIRALFPQINVLIICMCFCICQLLSMGQEFSQNFLCRRRLPSFCSVYVYVFSLLKWLEIGIRLGQRGSI